LTKKGPAQSRANVSDIKNGDATRHSPKEDQRGKAYDISRTKSRISAELERKILERADLELQRIADATGQQIRLLNITATKSTPKGGRSLLLYNRDGSVRMLVQIPWHAKDDGRTIIRSCQAARLSSRSRGLN